MGLVERKYFRFPKTQILLFKSNSLGKFLKKGVFCIFQASSAILLNTHITT